MSPALLATGRSAQYQGRANVLVLRSFLASRYAWWGVATGFLEPFFYLATMGRGLGQLVGSVHAPGGRLVSYPAVIAPALLASMTMNVAFYDLGVWFYFKLRHARLYEAMLTTPAGAADALPGEGV